MAALVVEALLAAVVQLLPAPNGDYIIAIDTAEGATILPNGGVSVKKGDDLNVSIKAR